MNPRSPSIDIPVVAFGPDATGARRGCFGVLLGVRRARRVDVVGFEPLAPVSGLSRTLEARFDDHAPWEAVGISLPHAETRGELSRLVEALVPGDVLATEKEIRVHTGERFEPVRASSL